MNTFHHMKLKFLEIATLSSLCSARISVTFIPTTMNTFHHTKLKFLEIATLSSLCSARISVTFIPTTMNTFHHTKLKFLEIATLSSLCSARISVTFIPTTMNTFHHTKLKFLEIATLSSLCSARISVTFIPTNMNTFHHTKLKFLEIAALSSLCSVRTDHSLRRTFVERRGQLQRLEKLVHFYKCGNSLERMQRHTQSRRPRSFQFTNVKLHPSLLLRALLRDFDLELVNSMPFYSRLGSNEPPSLFRLPNFRLLLTLHIIYTLFLSLRSPHPDPTPRPLPPPPHKQLFSSFPPPASPPSISPPPSKLALEYTTVEPRSSEVPRDMKNSSK